MADAQGRVRSRNFATVVYPDSAPEHWIDILGDMVIPAFVSPLHDRDFNPDGEPKKPHYHVMIMFDNTKTASQAKDVFDAIGGVGCEFIKSTRAYARYLCHLDNPDKFQYDPVDVRQFGGSCYGDICALSIDRYVAIAEVLDYCDENNIYSFRRLLQICREEHFEWFKVLCDGGVYVIKEYLKTAQWEDNNNDYNKMCDTLLRKDGGKKNV